MPTRFFQRIEPTLVRLFQRMRTPPPPNLLGDRDIEYSFISSRIPQGPGRSLEFGCGSSYLSLIAARKGFQATALDLQPVEWHYQHPNLTFLQIDVFDVDVPPSGFDLVLNCSSIEHVGLTRYGDRAAVDGDLEAMHRLRHLMKPSALMLLTIPVGRDSLFLPLHRVYGVERLPRLLDGLRVEHHEYWSKSAQNQWVEVDKKTALDCVAQPHVYGLGCFALRISQ